MEVMIGAIIGIAIGAVISGTLIWIVGKLGIGLSVKSFGWAMLAGLLIGIISTLVASVLPDSQGLLGAFVHLLVSAAVIFGAGKLLSGLTVAGPSGAILAACAIAAISYVIRIVLTAT